MENEKQFYRRFGALLVLFALCLLGFGTILYDAQVVHAQDYLEKSTTQVTTSKTVEASRGIIVDRNGKLLVSNQEIYTISLDLSLIPKEEGVSQGVSVSRAILRLLKLCQEHGVTWPDNLPLSGYAPYNYTTAEAGDTQRSRLQKYLSKRKWSDSELTAEDPYPTMSLALQAELGSGSGILPGRTLLQLMRKDFDIDPAFTDQEARLVAGVLYELKLRTYNDKTFYVPPYLFADGVSVELISILNDGNFHGVVIGNRSVRQYNTSRAAHILGRVGAIQNIEEEIPLLNAQLAAAQGLPEGEPPQSPYRRDDQVGRDGVEKAFETYLRGKDGKRLITTNEEGKITSELYSIEPQPGGTVALTLDIDLQASVEDYLAMAIQAMNAEDGSETRGGAAVVVSVENSDVLALASYPTYDPATYGQNFGELSTDPATPMVNRALSGAYAPGSTFKPCTAVAALESGVIDANTKILTKGVYHYYDIAPKCWIYRQYGGTHGRINVSEALYHSCNYFFYEVGRLTGIETLNQYAAAFGLGQPTGIELGERTGILDGPEYRAKSETPWYGGDVLQCAIGQGSNLFTPLQLANYIATLVRGGDRYNAHLLKTVTAYDGSGILYESQPETLATAEMSATTLAAVKKGMGDLVSTGSVSQYFKDCIVSAGAKTGSAQVGTEVANGVFVCFAPFDQPEIAVAIVIEQGGSGGALAATAVNILNAYFAPSDIGTAIVPEGTLLQ